MNGLNLEGATTWSGDTAAGRHMGQFIIQNVTDGTPAQPCLQLNFPGFWRFRWAVSAGSTHSISVFMKQPCNTAPYPSIVIKANAAIGVSTDLTLSSTGGTGWVSVGPLTTPSITAAGVLWVELHNNSTVWGLSGSTPAGVVYFDHLAVT